ncbi:MAG: hypothetical protein QM702_26445, partial [Rubrivivax sp.]
MRERHRQRQRDDADGEAGAEVRTRNGVGRNPSARRAGADGSGVVEVLFGFYRVCLLTLAI